MTFIANIKETFGAVDETKRDSGDLVSTIIIIAGMAVAAILAINWISTALLSSAADVAGCLEGSTSQFFVDNSATDNCADQDHAGQDGGSFTDTDGYQNRF